MKNNKIYEDNLITDENCEDTLYNIERNNTKHNYEHKNEYNGKFNYEKNPIKFILYTSGAVLVFIGIVLLLINLL